MAQIIATIDWNKYKTVITTGNHGLVGDEPAPHGQDLGPNPFDFLLVSLGTCVAMTLRMYADRKGWDLQKVEVELDQSRIHAKDCKDCESEEGYIHLIDKRLKFTGNLSPQQRQRLLEISEKCPVQKTLTHEIRVKSGLIS